MEWFKVTAVICFTYCGLCSAMSTTEIEDFKDFIEKTSHLDQIFVKKGVNPDTGYDDEDTISDHAWEDSGKFEGDLILNDRQRRIIVEDVAEGLSRNGINDITKRWPDNELVYYIHQEHFTSDQVQAIQNGIDDLAQASCVKFRPYKKGDRDAVVIQGGRRGCFSHVGYQGGYQILNLNGRHPPGRGCFRHGTIVHELLHSLGFYHMQSSPDRDDYIDVKWENIHQPARHNFRKYNTFSVSDFGVGYDYDSVLHYSRRAFSINGQDTLVPKQSGASIGQRIGLSDKDSQKLNKMYCDNSNSNSFDAADDPKKTPSHPTPNKKKKAKNEPFEGHGIGYHQGNTIAIKLPAAKTVKVAQIPTFHFFDPFSKTTQALPQETFKGAGTGKKVTQEYEYKPFKEENYVTPPNTLLHNTERERDSDILDDYENEDYEHYSDPYYKKEQSQTDTSDTTKSLVKNNDNDVEKVREEEEEVTEKGVGNASVDEAFDRLAKIIKTHVYPSQTPNLDVYKANTDYSDLFNMKKAFGTNPVIAKLDKKFPSRIIPSGNEHIEDIKHENNYKADDDKRKVASNEEKTRSESETNNEDFDSSYGTSFPLNNMPKVEDTKLVTPHYARFENLANKNDYSGLYYPKEDIYQKADKHALLGYLFHDVSLEKDKIKKDNEKYDREIYSHPVDDSHEHVISSKIIQYEHDLPAKKIFGRMPTGKAYSLFGVLVPVTHNWFRIDYEPLRRKYSIKKQGEYR